MGVEGLVMEYIGQCCVRSVSETHSNKTISNFATPEGSTLPAIEKKYIYRLIFRELNPLDVKRFLKHAYEF